MGSVIGAVTGGIAGGGAGGGYQNAPATVALPYTQAQMDQAQAASQTQLAQQQQLASQLAGQGGLGTQNNILAQQQALANTLGQQAAGQGPNPAQQQYQQNINAGTQAAAGTIASQKGISPALAAQLIAQQQGSANQNAAGTAATLQAQQQLAAQNALQGQQAQMQGVAGQQVANQIGGQNAVTSATQGQQGMMQGAQGSTEAINAGGANAAMGYNAQANQNSINRAGGLIGQLLAKGGEVESQHFDQGGMMMLPQVPNYWNQPAQTGGIHTALYGTRAKPATIDAQGNVSKAQAAQPGWVQKAGTGLASLFSSAPAATSAPTTTPTENPQNIVSPNQNDLPPTDPTQMPAILEARGGSIPRFDGGGEAELPAAQPMKFESNTLLNSLVGGGSGGGGIKLAKGGKVKIPDHLRHIAAIYHPELIKHFDEGGDVGVAELPSAQPMQFETNSFMNSLAGGAGKMMGGLAKGGYASYQQGALVPGKAKVDHNSYSNDTVKAMLSPGECVIPLDVMNSNNPAENAKKFVQELIDKKNKKGDNKEEFKVALKEALSKRKSK